MGKVAKKFALYPPRRMMEQLGLKEGQRVKFAIDDGKLLVEPVHDPIDIAMTGRKWAKTSVKEFEKESEREQQELYG